MKNTDQIETAELERVTGGTRIPDSSDPPAKPRKARQIVAGIGLLVGQIVGPDAPDDSALPGKKPEPGLSPPGISAPPAPRPPPIVTLPE